MHTHTQRKYHCIFTETPHTQCNQAPSQLVHNRIPWKPLWSQLPPTAAPSRSSTKSPRAGSWAAQKQVPSCCPPWAQQFSALITGSDYGVMGWLSCAAAGPPGVGCVSEALDQMLWQPMGQPVEWGLCLITSGHNFSSTILFPAVWHYLSFNGLYQHFFDGCVALISIPCHSRQEGTTQVIQWGSPGHVEKLHWNILLFS